MNLKNNIAVIIPAAGSSSRFDGKLPKQFLNIGHETVLEKTVNLFLGITTVKKIFIAINPAQKIIQSQSFYNHSRINIVEGGNSRSQSVLNALDEIDDDTLYIFVSEEIRCDEFSLEIVRTDGASLGVKYTPERCIQDGSMPEGHEDNPAGWSHLGAIHNLESGVSYDITTSDSFSAVSEDVIYKIIGDLINSMIGFGGGSISICCGVVILLIGLVLAIMKKEKATTYQIDEQGAVILDQQPETDLAQESG